MGRVIHPACGESEPVQLIVQMFNKFLDTFFVSVQNQDGTVRHTSHMHSLAFFWFDHQILEKL